MGKVAVNEAGDAVAGFTRWSGNGYAIQAAVRPAASGHWQQVVDLSDPEGNSPRGAGIAIDRAGNALTLWVRAGHSADSPVVVSSFRPAGGSWTAPVELGGPYGDVWNMGSRSTPPGRRSRCGARRAGGAGYIVFSSYRPFGGSWTRATSVSRPNVDDLSLAVSDSGNALALWREATSGQMAVVADARPAATGKWEPTVQLSPSGVYAGADTLAGDRAGNAVAVWTEGFGDASVR